MTQAEVLAAVAAGKMTPEDAQKALEKKLTLKVSQKGAVQLDGLRRFPVTLYKREWQRVLDMAPQILKFIEENKSKLASKVEE
jgi:hypothetical protein